MGCSVHPAFVGGSGFLIGVEPALGKGDASPTSPTFCGRVVPSSLANFRLGNALRGRVVCSEGLDGVYSSCIASSLFRSVGSREKMSTSCSSVKWMSVGKGMVFGTKKGGISLPVSPVEPWVVWFWDTFTGSLLPFDSPSCGTGMGDVGPVQSISSGSFSVSHWDCLFMATAVGAIVGGVAGVVDRPAAMWQPITDRWLPVHA